MWVAVGFYYGENNPSVNCDGVKRGQVLEWVMTIDHDSFDIDMVGARRSTGKIRIAKNKEPTFSFDMGGDAEPLYRCRLSSRNTLICLGPYGFV